MTLPRRVDIIRHPRWSGNLAETQSLLASERDMSEGPDELGIQQARNLGRGILRTIPKPDFIVSSPFLRARRGIEIAADEVWPDMTVITDARLIEQNKGTDEGDYYEDDNLPDREYPNGETLREGGRRILALLQEPVYEGAHLVVSTHARLMLGGRLVLGGFPYLRLRDQGLPNNVPGIMIANTSIDTYKHLPDPVTGELPPSFNEMRVRQTWGSDPLDSGPILL